MSPGLTRDRAVRQRSAAWIGTGMARYRSDRSETTHCEPDRNMKFLSCKRECAAVAIRTGGATRD
ncbi:hypothetical protein EMIT0111MI5_11174 [Burkholderia sp. IT-111MI5]